MLEMSSLSDTGNFPEDGGQRSVVFLKLCPGIVYMETKEAYLRNKRLNL